MIGERIKALRKVLGLSQTDFAVRIGTVQNTITGYETGRREPSNQVLTLICREFRVNEAWLRTGEGEMFVPTPSSVVDQLREEYDLCPEAVAMVREFIVLEPDAQKAIFEYMRAVVGRLHEQEIAEKSKAKEAHAEVERQLKKEKNGPGESQEPTSI